MEEKEIWKDIKGFEGYYQVSNLGRIKSLPRLRRIGNRMVMFNERILKDKINKQGYHSVKLYGDKERIFFYVHRLVYENFVGDIPEGMQVNHISECKDDNTLSNLNLMTPKENANYGTRNERFGRKHRKQVVMDNEKEFESMTQAADYLGCTKSNICKCCKNPIRTIYGHKFRYK